jgi:hypothetical protein
VMFSAVFLRPSTQILRSYLNTMPSLAPSTSSPIHYSLIIILFNVIYSSQLKASSKKPRIKQMIHLSCQIYIFFRNYWIAHLSSFVNISDLFFFLWKQELVNVILTAA